MYLVGCSRRLIFGGGAFVDARLQSGYLWSFGRQCLRTAVEIGQGKVYPRGSRNRGIGILILLVMGHGIRTPKQDLDFLFYR